MRFKKLEKKTIEKHWKKKYNCWADVCVTF